MLQTISVHREENPSLIKAIVFSVFYLNVSILTTIGKEVIKCCHLSVVSHLTIVINDLSENVAYIHTAWYGP